MSEKTSSLFHRKVYRKTDEPSNQTSKTSKKKIIATKGMGGLREEFKRTFLPLLIDIFELRQMIRNHKTEDPLSTPSKSPEEILKRLEQLQREIEESQRWHEGVILQISKGIHEAKDALEIFDKPKKRKGPIRLLKKIVKTLKH